jgi:membrane protease subunit (stomatin/prohibitin family)
MADRDQREAYQDEQLDQLQQQQAAQAPAPVAAAPATTDRVEALTKLKGLLDAGVLTDAEFQAEKARILGGG